MDEEPFDKTMARCDDRVYRHGEVVDVIGDHPGSERIDAWVREIRNVSGQKVDWHFFGGRAVIKAIGDLELVRNAMVSHPIPTTPTDTGRG